MQPLQQVLFRQLGLEVDDLITLVLTTKESIEENTNIFGVQLQEEIDLEAVEVQAREMFKVAALDIAADLDSIEAFTEAPAEAL